LRGEPYTRVYECQELIIYLDMPDPTLHVETNTQTAVTVLMEAPNGRVLISEPIDVIEGANEILTKHMILEELADV
jgi:hypothetical protein